MCCQADRAKEVSTANKNPKKADNSSNKPVCRPTGFAGVLMGAAKLAGLVCDGLKPVSRFINCDRNSLISLSLAVVVASNMAAAENFSLLMLMLACWLDKNFEISSEKASLDFTVSSKLRCLANTGVAK